MKTTGANDMKRVLTGDSLLSLALSLVAILMVLGVFVPSTYADANGRIRGSVVDSSGAAVVDATVKIVNVDTNLERTLTTTDVGTFDVPNLPPGIYNVIVTKSGFRTFKQSSIKLEVAATFAVTATLEVGEMSATVEVTAEKLQADTTTMQLGGELAGADLTDYPLLNRAWINLQQSLPGVVASSDRFGSNFSTNGSRTQSNNYTVNGTDSNDLPLNTPIANAINPDAIQEVKVVDSTLNPEYGRNSGGTLMVTTKSGTNQFHGSAFEFYRDTFMNAKNFFSTKVPPFHQNQFGGTIGGPIIKNKLFGFFSYQGTRQFQGVAQNSQVFTPAQRTGDFSGSGALAGTSPVPMTGEDGVVHPAGTSYATLFPTNHIPTVDFAPVSSNLLTKFIPLPNPVGGTAFQYSELITSNPNQYLARVDYNLSSKDTIFFYLFIQRAKTQDTLPFLPGATTPLPGFGQFSGTKIYQYTASETHVFNQHTLNEFKVGYNRFNFDAVEPSNVVSPSSLGFTGINPQNTKANSAPRIDVTGLFTMGFSDNGPQPRLDDTAQLIDNFSYTTGKHAFKFGVDIRRGHVANPFFFDNNGAFSFAGGGAFSTGNPGADFLLGLPDSYAQSSGSFIDARAWEFYSFIQDQWRLKSNLTFTYGIGWQIDTPLTDHFNHSLAINAYRTGQQSTIFPTAPKGLLFPGDQGISPSGYRTHYNNFAPRIGFAWHALKKLTFRAGWGIYYDNSEEELTLQNLIAPPFALIDFGAGDVGLTSSFAAPFTDQTLATTIPNKYPFTPPAAGAAVNFNFFEPLSLNVIDPTFNTQYVMNMQLTAQYQFTPTILGTFSYVGAQGRRLEGVHELNPYNASVCLATAGCPANRAVEFAFPGVGTIDDGFTFASIGEQSTFLHSKYNSFQATVEKSLSHGLSLRAAYTFAHALDNGSSFEAGNVIPSNFNLTYGNSAFDARHRFVAEYLYQIPDWGFHHLPSRITKGWTISGVTSLQTGFPIALSESDFRTLQCTPLISFYGCWDRPNIVAPVQTFSNPRNVQTLPGATGVNRKGNFYFAPASFAREGCTAPTQPIATCGFGIGDAGRNLFHGPGLNNTDMSFYKDTQITEKVKIQFRADLFNAFNHAQFNNPSGNVASSLFGRVTTTRIPARISQLSLSLNF